MSYCSIIEFKDYKPNKEIEFKNSWGGAAFIWTALYNKYLKDPEIDYDTWVGKTDRKLWDLAKRIDIPIFMRAVHAATFDYATIKREHFKQYVEDLHKFEREFKNNKVICHLTSWANIIEKSDAEVIGFHATSVSENLWYDWDEEKEETIFYDLNTRKEHFEVYDWLETVKNYYSPKE